METRRIALFDIDRTVYNGYLIFPLSEYFFSRGIIGRDIVENLNLDLRLYRAGEVDYETSVDNMNIHFGEGLKGRRLDATCAATADFLATPGGNGFFPFAVPLVELLGKTHDVYFVTGEMQCIGKAVADHFSVQGYAATEMEVKEGIFTGAVIRSLAKKEGKTDAVRHILDTYPREGSLAFGDSEGDMDMLDGAAHAFCINATQALNEAALRKGWHIVTPLTIMEEVKKVLEAV